MALIFETRDVQRHYRLALLAVDSVIYVLFGIYLDLEGNVNCFSQRRSFINPYKHCDAFLSKYSMSSKQISLQHSFRGSTPNISILLTLFCVCINLKVLSNSAVMKKFHLLP